MRLHCLWQPTTIMNKVRNYGDNCVRYKNMDKWLPLIDDRYAHSWTFSIQCKEHTLNFSRCAARIIYFNRLLVVSTNRALCARTEESFVGIDRWRRRQFKANKLRLGRHNQNYSINKLKHSDWFSLNKSNSFSYVQCLLGIIEMLYLLHQIIDTIICISY